MKTLCTMIMALGLSLAATAIPTGEFTSAEAVDATTVRFNWSVSGGTGSADLVLKYGLSSGSFEFEKTIATCTSVSGDYTADVGGFRSGTEYEGRLYLRSGNTDRVFGIVFGFSSGAGITAKPGFRQSYVDGNAWANGFDIESNVTVGFTDRPYAVHVSQYNPQSWTVYKDDGTSYVSGWSDNRTLGYHTSFWMDSTKTYIFGINVDDSGSVWIDGTEVFASGGSGGIDIWNIPRVEYKPSTTGWHDLKLYVGNGIGGYGPYPCNHYPNSGDTFLIGIGWSTDNAATWNYFDNTESATYFKVFDPLAAKVERGAIAGGKAAFVVNFGEQVAGATVYAYAADSFKGDDVEDWGEPVETGMLGSSGVYQFYFDNPAGASYYRFVAALGTTVCNSEAIPVDELEVVDSSKPSVMIGTVAGIGAGYADIEFNVLSCGDTETCDITVKYGYLEDDLEFSKSASGVAAGPCTIHLDDLEPFHFYCVKIEAADSSATASSGMLSFETPALPTASTVPADAPGYSHPGVWQADEIGGFTQPILEHPTRVRTLGTWAADVYYQQGDGPYWTVWTLDGEEKQVMWYNYAYFGYAGYMFLDKNTTYTISGSIDDNVRFSIDGILKLGGNGSFSYTPSYTGWHPFEAIAIDGGGWAGSGSGYGFSITPAGGATRNIRDSGDGSFLRTAPSVRDGEIVSYEVNDDGVLHAEIEFSSWQSTEEINLYVAYGMGLGGNEYSSWESTKKINAKQYPITADYNGYHQAELAGAGTDFKYAHFYTVDSEGTWQWCGEIITVNDGVRPVFSSEMSVDGTFGDRIIYKGSLLSAGSGETAALAFLVSRNADMSGAVSYTNANSYAAGDAIEYEIFESKNSTKYIVPGVTYYVRAVFTGTNGKKNVSSPMKVTTLAGAAFKAGGFAASMNSESAVGTFSGVLETVGAYTNALVSFYAGMGDNNFTLVDTVTITEDNTPFSFNYTVPTDGSVVYYYYKVVNSCPTKAWSTTTDTMYKGIEYVFYWKSDVYSGKWEDPDNWTCSVAGMEDRYPDEWVWFDRADHHGGGAHWHSNHIAMFPSGDTNVTYEISLSSYVKLNRMYFLTEGMKIRFTGTGYTDMGDGLGGYNDPNKSGIYHDNYTSYSYVQPNIDVTYRNMYLDFSRVSFNHYDTITFDNTYARMRANSSLGDNYPTGAKLKLVNGAVYSQEGEHFLGYGTDFTILIEDSTFRVPSWGQLFFARNAWCSGDWKIEFYGTRPVLDVRYFTIAGADEAGNSSNLSLVFHVPKGGYSEAPIKCHNDGDWAFYHTNNQKPLNITVAADSPACFPGNLLDTALITVDQPGNFNAANLVLASGEEFRTYYADGNRAEVEYSSATQIRARIATKKLPTSIHVR